MSISSPQFTNLLRSSSSVFSISALFYIILGSPAAHAQCTATNSSQITWNQETYDPRPSSDPNTTEDELVLPMPCGGAMVFHRVVVPSTEKDFLAHKTIIIGRPMETTELQSSDSNAYNIYQFKKNLSAPFKDSKEENVYYIGKYEVSAAQYKAVMEGNATAPTKRRNFPATNISFLEAQQFAEKWTSWLHKNARDRLPLRAGQPGFIRLPTDAEWSFAASGGINNDKAASWPQDKSPCANDLDNCIAGNSQARQSDVGPLPNAIGSRTIANPLTLYDIVGNASEMVLNPYQINLYGPDQQRQGLAGGIQIFGGSVQDKAADISSSYRSEFYPYTPQGDANRDPDVGFRVVIAADAMERGSTQSKEAREAFLDLIKYAGRLNTSQVQKDNKETDAALSNLKEALSKNSQDTEALKSRIHDLSVAISAAKEAQNQANLQRDKADQENIIANLTTLLTLSRQIATDRVTIFNYNAFLSDPESKESPNLNIYRASIPKTEANLRETLSTYLSILKSVSRDPQLNIHLNKSRDYISNNLAIEHKGHNISDELGWLDIAIYNSRNIANGMNPDIEKDIGQPIEKAAHLRYYNK